MKEPSKCINCGTSLSGNYCSSCGQRASVNRISIKSFFEDYLSRLFGMDTNFLRTLRDLTVRPGQVARTFIEGNRVKYVGPIGYFFLLSTLLILTFQGLGINIKEFLIHTSQSYVAQSTDSKTLKMQSDLIGLVSNNLKILTFLIIPIFAMWGFIMFKKSKFNFFEHSVNVLYIQGHLVIAKIISLVFFSITGVLFYPYLTLIDLPFFIWACFGFYQLSGVKNIFKLLLLFVASYLSFIIFIMLLTIVYLMVSS